MKPTIFIKACRFVSWVVLIFMVGLFGWCLFDSCWSGDFALIAIVGGFIALFMATIGFASYSEP